MGLLLAVTVPTPATLNGSARRSLELHRGVHSPRRQRLCAAPATCLRSAGRSTSFGERPDDSSIRRRTSRGRPAKEKEPFDTELLVLFGIPVLVLVIAYAFNDPTSLALALPLLLLIPGPRDVLLHVVGDMFTAARRARRFVSMDEDYADATQRQQQREEQRRQGWRQAQWSKRPPPPPPPPVVAYELRQGDYNVNLGQPAPPTAASQQVPRSPFAEGWPPATQQLPRSPFADGWPSTAQQMPRSPFADGWPPSTPDPSRATWQKLPPGDFQGWSAAGGTDSSGTTDRQYRPHGRGGGPMAGVVGRNRHASRLAHRTSKSRVGVNVGGERQDATPPLLHPILALVPFLQYWGGFL